MIWFYIMIGLRLAYPKSYGKSDPGTHAYFEEWDRMVSEELHIGVARMGCLHMLWVSYGWWALLTPLAVNLICLPYTRYASRK